MSAEKRQGPIQKIINSFVGIIIGIILLPLSLGLIYYGENLKDYAKIVENTPLIENF